MSRNLCKTECDFCGTAPKLDEPARPITESEAGRHHFLDYDGMLVADATCPLCEAKYLAWVDESDAAWVKTARYGNHPPSMAGPHRDFFDLSFRSSFNDEPGDDDYPVYEVKLTRVGPFRKPG